ncbi:phosphoribosylanthranilate isomerase [Maribacter sp. 2210JD10-5]|uniref:phosphoribosylanthranilate isomerase n=1 Tax=Maribacter sp. 2210JD10-5 TaxID=3386272 RepID=UPI0039BC8520
MNKNTLDVATLKPDYLGFIFWEPSKRYFNTEMPSVPHSVKKVGVFVNAPINEVLEKVAKYDLHAVQLHGKERPDFCKRLKEDYPSFRAESRNDNEVSTPLDRTEKILKIIKVFSIKDDFDFDQLKPFENVCDFFLFDTKGKLPGGNGYRFDWKLLENYPSTKPYFLSGGIGMEETESLLEFLKTPESKYCHAIDVNSKFEIEPGLKEVEKVRKFKEVLYDL